MKTGLKEQDFDFDPDNLTEAELQRVIIEILLCIRDSQGKEPVVSFFDHGPVFFQLSGKTFEIELKEHTTKQ